MRSIALTARRASLWRDGLRPFLALVCSGLALPMFACSAPNGPVPPTHVIFITWDSVRADHVSSYGYARPTTPTLDAMAADSVVFETAISQHNWTKPSYGSIITSRHNWEFPGLSMREGQLTLAEVLQAHGYRTLGFVQNPNLSAQFDFDQGFDSYVELHDQLPAEQMTRAIIEGLEERSDSEQPLFLFTHYQGPHWPYRPESDFGKQFIRPDSVPVSNERITQLMVSHGEGWDASAVDADAQVRYIHDLYDAALRETDAALAELIAWLRQQSLWDDSLIIFNSDHGEELADRGRFGHAHKNLYPELTHVPLIFRFPQAHRIGPRRVTVPVQNLDIFPTVLDALDIPVPDDLSGRSLLPIESLRPDGRTAISNVGAYVAFRRPGHSLIADYQKTGFREPAATRRNPQYWFFDLSRDPNERSPLPDAEQHPVFTELRRAADPWYQVFRRSLSQQPTDDTPAISKDVLDRLRSLGYVR